MSLLQTAYYAKVLKGDKGASTTPKPSGISESIAQKPIQWLIVAGVVVYFGQKFLGKSITTGAESRTTSAETTTSTENPFSFKSFLAQKIPTGTKLLTASGAYQNAKQVHDALNVYLSEDEDIAIGVFTALPSKTQVAQVAEAFYNYYKKDILYYLKNGNKTIDFGTGGLSDSEYQRVIDNVTRKPKF
tara:strand:+ start:54 stop:617 length:564 start_codon:yes stop_codon:yes gene_type:complete